MTRRRGPGHVTSGRPDLERIGDHRPLQARLQVVDVPTAVDVLPAVYSGWGKLDSSTW